jgi:hypothetical protein
MLASMAASQRTAGDAKYSSSHAAADPIRSVVSRICVRPSGTPYCQKTRQSKELALALRQRPLSARQNASASFSHAEPPDRTGGRVEASRAANPPVA